MKKKRFNLFIFLVSLIAITSAAMAYSSNRGKAFLPGWMSTPNNPPSLKSGPMKISGQLIQDKIRIIRIKRTFLLKNVDIHVLFVGD